MAEAVGDREVAARCNMDRSWTLAKLGRPDEADQSLDRAEAYVREPNRDAIYLSYLQYRGLVRLLNNRYEEAAPYFELVLEKARMSKREDQIRSAIVNLAWCRYRLGDLDQAAAMYQELLSGTEDRYLTLGHLGNIYRDRRDYNRAADYYRQAAELARGRNREYYSTWLSNLASTLCDEQRWLEAQEVNQQALAVKKTIQSARGAPFETLNAARIAAGQGDVQQAVGIYQQLTTAPETDPTAAVEGSGRLAQLYAQTHRPDLARRQFEEALAMADKRRADLREDDNKLNYVTHLIDLDQQYVEFLASHNEKEAAFAAAEASRARLLRERMGLPPTAAGSRGIAVYQAAARAANVTFLSYWIAPEKSYLWEITGNGFITVPLPGEPKIRELVEHYQAGLEKDRTIDRKSGEQLFDLLLGNSLPSTRGRFVIVPDGPLFGLNLETLPAGPDGHFWLEDATVMVTPSLDLLRSNRENGAPNRSLLLVGDADEWDDGFPKLPNAAREMHAVSQNFSPDQSGILAGPKATPAGYESAHPENYRFIHLAAHATASRDYPLEAAIVLSREGDRGKLSVKDVLRMQTHAELVTLSACRSAGARTYAGEGLVGLAWAFLQSGARNVIAGLWDVSDYSSPPLMEQLYAGLASKKTPAEALRDAKLALLKGGKYAHPFYWGAFQLYAGGGGGGKARIADPASAASQTGWLRSRW